MGEVGKLLELLDRVYRSDLWIAAEHPGPRCPPDRHQLACEVRDVLVEYGWERPSEERDDG